MTKSESKLTPQLEAMQKAFGESLRSQRHFAGCTQQEVADRCEMNIRYYQDLEAGKKQASLSTLFRLSTALQCEPTTLIEASFSAWCNEGN